MKICLSFIALALLSAPFMAHASCDEVKSSIDGKLKANGVPNYKLDVVAKDQAGDGKVVGQCDGGSKVIVYTRGQNGDSEDEANASEPAKSEPAKDDAASAPDSSSSE